MLFCVYISHLNWVTLTGDILNELRNIFLHQIFMRSNKWWCRQKRKMITNKYACARWFRIFFLLFIIFIFFGDKLCFSFLSHEFIYLHIIKSQNISILLLREKIQLNQAQYLPHHCENFYFFYKCGPGNSWSIF